MRALLLLLPVIVVACSPAATPSPAPASSVAPPPPPSASHHEMPRPPAPMALVTVAFDGTQVDVDLAKAAKGAATAPLLDVWKEAFPSDDATKLTFDLVGSEGYRPTSRPNCTHLLSGPEMAGGKVEVTSHDVSFDDSLKLAKCYRVKALSRIEGKKVV